MNYTYGQYAHQYSVNKYKITPSNTAYSLDTPDKLVELLEQIREDKTRITIYYGMGGKEWGDKDNCTLGRSNGQFKVPLAIKTKRSSGGTEILTGCIARITSKGNTIYQA